MRQQLSDPPALTKLAAMGHFSSAVRVGDTVWLSGMVGCSPEGKPVEGMAAQARLAFEYLRAALAQAGATLSDVVEITTFHTDLQDDMRAFYKAKEEFFPTKYPAWTAGGVTQLSVPGLLVEIRAIAVAGSGAST